MDFERVSKNATMQGVWNCILEDCKVAVLLRHCVVATLPERRHMKHVQISEKLFLSLVRYFLLEDFKERKEIKIELEEKFRAMVRRDLYSKYKTARTPEEREAARKAYLDEAGIPNSFRW